MFLVSCQITVSRIPNGKSKAHTDVTIDLSRTKSIADFKCHLLQQIEQPISHAPKYALSTQNSNDLQIGLFSTGDLQRYIQQRMITHQKLIFTMERFLVTETTKNFDLNGERLQNEEVSGFERPNHKIYPADADVEVECAFCLESSANEALRERVGPVYEVKLKNQKIYVHELCAIWTPEVFLNDDNKLMNLHQALPRCAKLSCTFCGEQGAGLGCQVESCPQNYHYFCAQLSGAHFVTDEFQIYCNEHKGQFIDEAKDQLLQKYLCCECGDTRDEAKTVICDKCEKAYHVDCHDPEIEDKYVGTELKWLCQQCNERDTEEEKQIFD